MWFFFYLTNNNYPPHEYLDMIKKGKKDTYKQICYMHNPQDFHRSYLNIEVFRHRSGSKLRIQDHLGIQI